MYSELVDAVILRGGRPDQIANIQAWANQTIRDMSVWRGAFFGKSRIEETIVAPSVTPYLYTVPARLFRMEAIQMADGNYAELYAPGKALRDKIYYYYRTTTAFAIFGHGNANINISYAQYAPRFKYYAGGSADPRPAVYDFTTETWTYWDSSLTTPAFVSTLGSTALDLAAQALVSHWVLLDWFDLAAEGTLAKLFKAVDDTKKAATHFSFFQQTMAAQFMAAELLEGVQS